jgi:acetyl-CoA carboxylase biotin carboxyl carrier protein
MKEMNQTDLTKLEIEEEGIRICLEKAPAVAAAVPVQFPVPQVNVNAPMPAAQIPAPFLPSGEASDKQAAEECGNKVLSPMVGTFYSQASPEKPPFVKLGDKVKKGQTICIIEAMKLMNEIESEFDGEVVSILSQNEEMVQFGQPLFVIR